MTNETAQPTNVGSNDRLGVDPERGVWLVRRADWPPGQWSALVCPFPPLWASDFVRYFTAEHGDIRVAAERERCSNVLRYWLTGDVPNYGTHEALCLENIMDGSAAPWRPRPKTPNV